MPRGMSDWANLTGVRGSQARRLNKDIDALAKQIERTQNAAVKKQLEESLAVKEQEIMTIMMGAGAGPAVVR
eukprot:g2975.t1